MNTVQNYMNLWRNGILHQYAEGCLLSQKKMDKPVLIFPNLFQTDLTVYPIEIDRYSFIAEQYFAKIKH